MWNATFESKVEPKSNMDCFDCFSRRYGKRRIEFEQSNLIDSNVAPHMHLSRTLSSAHVKFDVWTGSKTSSVKSIFRLLLKIDKSVGGNL